MSNRNRNKNGFFSDKYWQSADYGRRETLMYQQVLYSLAMTRFQWIGLPDTCDERYLEYTLLYSGMATIAHPENMDTWFSTQIAAGAPMNLYDRPTKWTSVGNNGWSFDVTPDTGVVVYENRLRMPILSQLDIYARRLAHVDRALDVNISQQMHPMLITGDKSQYNDMINAYKQIAGGEPAIIATNAFSDNVNISAINTQVPFIGENLQFLKQSILSECYNFLGIDSITRKSERMIEDEVNVENMPTALKALDPLNTRREACKILNDRFGMDVHVVKRTDYESENWNFLHNIKERVELEEPVKEGESDGTDSKL